MHPHRLSDLATGNAVEAIVGPAPAGELREHSALGNLELKGSSSNTGPGKLEPRGTRAKGRLSDKYLAGLLDSDGCICLKWYDDHKDQTGPRRAQAVVSFSQKTPDHSFMRLIASSLTPPSLADVWGTIGTIAYSGTHHWVVAGSKAVSVLMRLRKFLVLKRALADCAIDMNGKFMDVEEGKQRFDAARGASPMPKHPTRKWAAGYIEGNGTFNVNIPNGLGGHLSLMVCDEAIERVGVDLLKKAYGGSIREHLTPHGTPIVTWTLWLDAAKVRSMFESGKTGLAKHMVLKTDQIYFLLGCAKMGHFRDGERIKAGLEQLRSQAHRLSGPGAHVAELLKTVRDVPSFMGPGSRERKRQWAEAVPLSD
jgi:hypothetical protein